MRTMCEEVITTASGIGKFEPVNKDVGILPPKQYQLLFVLLGILTYLTNHCFDIMLLREYHSSKQWLWFGLTLSSVLIPIIIVHVLSLKMFRHDNGTSKWSTIMLHCLGLGLIQRYCIVFSNGRSARKEPEIHSTDTRCGEPVTKKYKFIEHSRDVSLLRFFYAFMETAPQVTVQLCILLNMVVRNPKPTQVTPTGPIQHLTYTTTTTMDIGSYSNATTATMNTSDVNAEGTLEGSSEAFALFISQAIDHHATQIVKITITLVGLTVALVGYNSDLRDAKGTNLSVLGFLFQILYRFCFITSRIFVFVLLVRSGPWYISLSFFISTWLFMIIWVHQSGWIFFTKGNKCCNAVLEIVLRFLMGYIYMFCYVATHDGSQFWQMMLYYGLFYTENTVILVLSVWLDRSYMEDFEVASVALTLGLMVFGLVFLFVYYEHFHPKSYRIEGKRKGLFDGESLDNNTNGSRDYNKDEITQLRQIRDVNVMKYEEEKDGEFLENNTNDSCDYNEDELTQFRQIQNGNVMKCAEEQEP